MGFCASSHPPAELSGLLLALRAGNFLEGIMKGFQTVELSPLKEFTSLVHINSLEVFSDVVLKHENVFMLIT